MKIKNKIAFRWLTNSIGISFMVFLFLVITITFVYKNWVYSAIKQVLYTSSEEFVSVFSYPLSKYETPDDFEFAASKYIESFSNKASIEVLCVSSNRQRIISSSGFTPKNIYKLSDIDYALKNNLDVTEWNEKLGKEGILSVTRLVKNSEGGIIGIARFASSTKKADRAILIAATIMTALSLFILLLIFFIGLYFIKTLVNPINTISSTADRIASGNFEVRIEKQRDDEIGNLIDSINKMAVGLGNTDKMKNDFISSISHELKTPLTSISGWAETLSGNSQDTETLDKGLGIMVKESDRLTRLVNELLDFSRLESNSMKLILSRVDIIAELDDAVFFFEDRAKAENKSLSFNDEGFISPVICDADRLKQVFINIIDNALKYTEKGGKIDIAIKEEENSAIITIEDNGMGINKNDLPHIKEKFYKANLQVNGSGIGLAVADEIIRLHHGTLNFESEEGNGTKVTITLPTEKNTNSIVLNN